MKLKRQTIPLGEFKKLIDGSKVIVPRKEWPKVCLKNGEYIKFFSYKGKGFRRRHINPVATEFVRNAERIARLGIETVKPSYWARCPDAQCDVVICPTIPGRTVYSAYRTDRDLSLFPLFAEYIATLHAKNFYFRHGHSDNYLIRDDSTFAIIDIDNVRFSMNLRRRAKNLFYLLEHSERKNHHLFDQYGVMPFLEQYFHFAGASKDEQQYIIKMLRSLGLQFS